MPDDARATPAPEPSTTGAETAPGAVAGAGRDARAPVRELARRFLTHGTVAFGGPAAQIAMMEDEVVTRRRWRTRERFLDLLGATNLIPGPNSTELAIHIGHARAGWRGLLVAGACFILPAALIVTAIAWAYVHFGTLPQVDGVLYGVKPVVIAVVLQALWRLGRTAVTSPFLGMLALFAAAANVAGLGEIAVLLVTGGLAASVGGRPASRYDDAVASPAMWPTPVPVATVAVPSVAVASATTTFGLWPLFLFFAKIGAVLFGSGYVLLAFLRSGLVVERGWLTEAQLLDAIAIGQVTPGPVFTTATFIGYLLGGGAGAVVATVGIFLPAFAFVAISGPLVPRLRRSRVAGAVLDGVNVASLALMAVVTVRLGAAALVDVPTALLAIASAGLLLRWRVNSAWLVVAGGALGILLRG